ncbi:AaceriABR166Cp [[Ashbya] aceris (nom. inval.)]|nr:AaceriABR166Cp [[Ashbya] aceris (nom. inval.)]
MAVFSHVTVIYARIGFLLTLAFFSVKDVELILNHSFIIILARAMNLPELHIPRHSAQLGMVSVLFFLLAVSDLLPLLENNLAYFDSLVPFRLLAFFILALVSYLRESNLYFHNNAVFVYCFCEIIMHFMIYTAIKDEQSGANTQRLGDTTAEDEASEDELEELVSSTAHSGDATGE